MKPFKLINIKKGYAEVWVSFSGNFDDIEVDGLGFVHTEEVVSHTDFENDKIYYQTRWFPFIYTGRGEMNGYTKTGRETGYATRKEALEELLNEINEKQ